MKRGREEEEEFDDIERLRDSETVNLGDREIEFEFLFKFEFLI